MFWLEPFVAVDVETTGLDAEVDRLLEVATVRVRQGRIIDAQASVVRPDRPVPDLVARLTGLSDDVVQHAPGVPVAVAMWTAATRGARYAVAYNAGFDRAFLSRASLATQGASPLRPFFDPFLWVRHLEGDEHPLGLAAVCERHGIEMHRAHRALDDALAVAQLFTKLAPRLGVTTVDEALHHQRGMVLHQMRQAEQKAARRSAGALAAAP